MKRTFDDIMAHLKTTIAGYDYFVDFKKVYSNVSELIIPLNILNSLIGINVNFDEEFIKLIHKYPETLHAVPILLAVRAPSYKMNVIDNTLVSFDFKKIVNTDEEYIKFFTETGLKELFVGGHIKNLIDYVTGVEVGLDSNARKNRSGTNMENIVGNYLKLIPDTELISQAEKDTIIKEFGYDELNKINLKEGKNQAEKRFDFALKYKDIVYLIETNFYGGGGSKLNEVARSYEKLADDINKLEHYKFLWITDGIGWRSARRNLQESYSHQQLMMTLWDLENSNLIKEIKNYSNKK